MSNRDTIGLKPDPLLPREPRKDRPLFLVLAIMAFLSCLSVIAAQASFRSAGQWQQDMAGKAIVQVLEPSAPNIAAAVAATQAYPGVSDVSVQPDSESRALLKPWLGGVDLPDDIPVPAILTVELSNQDSFDAKGLSEALANKNIRAEVDDFGRWRQRLSRTSRAVQTVSILAVLLLLLATIAAAGFATQAALAARENVVKVLNQVGAQDKFVSKIFTVRFFKTGLKAGAVGALAALIVLLLVWMLTGTGDGEDGAFMAGFSLTPLHIVLLLLMPLLTAAVCAISAGRTVQTSLARDRKL